MEQKTENKAAALRRKEAYTGKSKSFKASHLSSNPIQKESLYHSHFEVEVNNAFLRIFNINL